jgi:hypothetical protein
MSEKHYLGSKAQAGVWQRIICQMPPHDFYVEPFLGSGQIFFRKLPAANNVLIDADAGVIARIGASCRRRASEVTLPDPNAANDASIRNPGVRVICGDALLELATLKPALTDGTVIYCDPPYLFSTRTSRHRYKHEFGEEDQHAAFLALVQSMNCRVLISGYPSKLYAQRLKDWRCISYRTRTRGRTLLECLWCNFPEPTQLHDWRFIGKGYRERLTLKRFAARFLARLDRMSALKKNFVLHLVKENE